VKLKIIPEAFDVVPPGLLEQLQVALNAAGEMYGIKFKSEIAPDDQFDPNQRYWQWLSERNGTEGG
jgi:hypothetical protein